MAIESFARRLVNRFLADLPVQQAGIEDLARRCVEDPEAMDYVTGEYDKHLATLIRGTRRSTRHLLERVAFLAFRLGVFVTYAIGYQQRINERPNRSDREPPSLLRELFDWTEVDMQGIQQIVQQHETHEATLLLINDQLADCNTVCEGPERERLRSAIKAGCMAGMILASGSTPGKRRRKLAGLAISQWIH
jgi:hypothetical protein